MKDRKYRIVFSDIDGTLLDETYTLTPYTKKRVHTLYQHAIPFVLVSARMPNGVYHVQKQLGITSPIICYSGALTLDENGGKTGSVTMDKDTALKVKGLFETKFPDICCTAYFDDTWVSDDAFDPWVVREGEITSCTPIALDLSEIAPKEGIHKFLCMGDARAIKQAEDAVRRMFPELTVYRSKSTYLEIMSGQAKKSFALRALCKKEGIAPEESIAFGDHFNDADMLEAAGFGAAMANAPDEVKKCADFTAPSNKEDGLAKTLEMLFPDLFQGE